MMNKMRLYLIIIQLIILNVSASAAIHDFAGTRSGQFLRIGPSARASAVGGAFTAGNDDNAAIDWNPSGITSSTGFYTAAMTFGKWFADTNYGNLSFLMPFGNKSALGLSLTYLNYGSMIKTGAQDDYGIPVENGTFSANDMNIALGCSYKVWNNIRVGGTIKYLKLSIDDVSGTGTGIDIGVQMPLVYGIESGIALKNIGSMTRMKSADDPLAEETALGFKRISKIDKDHSIGSYLDFVKPVDNNSRINFGAEYGFKDMYFLRAGWRANYDTEGLTAGFGVNINSIRLDYAFAPFNALGDTHKITVLIKIGKNHEKIIQKPEGKTLKDLAIIQAQFNLTGLAVSTTSIKWNWDKLPFAVSYVLTDKGTGKELARLPGQKNEWISQNLTQNTVYTYKVIALDVKDGQMRSAQGSQSTMVMEVEDFKGVPISSSAIKWTWKLVPDVTSYYIFDGSNNELVKELGAENMWIEKDLDENSNYVRYIKAANLCGAGMPSAMVKQRTFAKAAMEAVAKIQSTAKNINFDTDSSAIRKVDIESLNAIAELIIEVKPDKVRIEGHTDNRGNAAHNIKLSQQRADSVVEYLVKRGVSSEILKPQGFGGSVPVSNNDTMSGSLENRRVEFVFIRASDGAEIRPSHKMK